MCLWTKSPLPGPEFDGYCYKLVKPSEDGKIVIGGMSAGVPFVKLSGNRWIRDTVDGTIDYAHIADEYPSGFHCFLNLEDAVKIKNRMTDVIVAIIKVRVRDIIVAGMQGWNFNGGYTGYTVLQDMPSIVAREIRFVKRMP